jgi:hypothetical protein
MRAADHLFQPADRRFSIGSAAIIHKPAAFVNGLVQKEFSKPQRARAAKK